MLNATFSDLCFQAKVQGRLPDHHHYPLYASLCRLAPPFHGSGAGVLLSRGWLRIRAGQAAIRWLAVLAGQTLRVGGASVTLGPAVCEALAPASACMSRIVVIKPPTGVGPMVARDWFAAALMRQLRSLSIHGVPQVGPRRIVSIKGAVRPGYQVRVAGLTAEDSLQLQSHGLGGRRSFGCGWFDPD